MIQQEIPRTVPNAASFFSLHSSFDNSKIEICAVKVHFISLGRFLSFKAGE